MNGILEQLRAHAERIGGTGVAGIALMAFAAAFYGSAIAPLEAEVAKLRAEAARLEAKFGLGGKLPGAPNGDAGEQLATFYAFFPRSDSSPAWLAKIHAAAQAKGIVLQSGEYRLDRRADQRLARYQITLPVTATYPQIRAFIGEVLAEVPAAALEEITLRRESAASPTVEARIRFALFLGSA